MNLTSRWRRVSAFLLLVFTVLSFAACDDQNKIPASSDPLGDFSAFLDREGFTASPTEGDVDRILAGYSINGKTLERLAKIDRTELNDGWSYGGYGSGFAVELRRTVSEGKVTDTLYFYARATVDGLALPCGITMQDSLDTVTARLGFEKNLRGRFQADGGAGMDMTLISQDGRSLVFRNLLLTEGSMEDVDPLRFVFTERKTVTRADGTTATLVRTVEFTFRYESGFPIHEVYYALSEERGVNAECRMQNAE